MKKLLIATTALVATAGVAAAEVTISGNARMGVVYNGADLNFSSRIRASVSMSGTTDGGLEFGGSFGIHDAGAAANGDEGSVYISGAFGKLEMGATVGAAEAVIGDLPEIGFSDLTSQVGIGGTVFNVGENETTFITGDGAKSGFRDPELLYTYSTGGLTFALSLSDGKELGDRTNGDPTIGSLEIDQEMAVGVKYAFGDYSVALAYESVNVVGGGDYDHLVLGAEATFGTTTVKLVYGQGGGSLDGFDQLGLGVTSTFDAVTVKAYVKQQSFGSTDIMSYGIGGEYDLGGGAVVAGGIADNDLTGSDPVADLGLKFSF